MRPGSRSYVVSLTAQLLFLQSLNTYVFDIYRSVYIAFADEAAKRTVGFIIMTRSYANIALKAHG